ncbi:MAG TPA: hypothetical protein VL485_00065 [Ktedonobacteraceae bacterium]|nr:hypothetical protein [Ktedonobacteraceae bacterium]
MILWMRALRHPEFRERLIRFSKQTLNPNALKIAGHPASAYALIQHVGRHSGRTYATPIVARPLGNDFVIPLPYGSNVDWCRNVLVAKTCTLTWNGHDYTMDQPEIVPPEEAIGAFPLVTRLLFTAGGMNQYLCLHRQQETPEELPTHEDIPFSLPTI